MILKIKKNTAFIASSLPILLSFAGCGGLVRGDIADAPETTTSGKILSLAVLAPSGHNTQPWTVRMNSATEWVVGWERTRSLPAVDPENRELLLSIGAFCEAASVAASAYGFSADIRTVAKTNFDDRLVELRFAQSTPSGSMIETLKKRRTIRKGIRPQTISSADREFISKNVRAKIFFFDRDSAQGRVIEKAVFESNVVQANRIEAVKELSAWIRWNDAEAARMRNGLTPESMEITGFPGLYVRHFYKPQDVLTDSFKQSSIDTVKDSLSSYGCWIVIVTDDSSPKELVSAGGDFLRIGLAAQQRSVAIHPMTQPLEEIGFSEKLTSDLGIKKPIQFILRAGYAGAYSDPASVRMNIKDVIK
jgi:hypothetical protein